MKITSDITTKFGELVAFEDGKKELKEILHYGERLRAAKGAKNVGEMLYSFTQNEDALRENWYKLHALEAETGERFTDSGKDYSIQKIQEYDYSGDVELQAINKQIAMVEETLKTYRTERAARKAYMRYHGLATVVGTARYVTKCYDAPKNVVVEEPIVIPINNLSNPA